MAPSTVERQTEDLIIKDGLIFMNLDMKTRSKSLSKKSRRHGVAADDFLPLAVGGLTLVTTFQSI